MLAYHAQLRLNFRSLADDVVDRPAKMPCQNAPAFVPFSLRSYYSLPTATMKRAALQLLALSSTTSAFVGTGGNSRFVASPLNTATSTIYEVDPVQATKPTGTSFLPEETVERAKAGNKIEKVKMAKDPTSAFVDVYEYARKIREGEMTWEEVEAADLDTVSCHYFVLDCTMAIK